MRDEEGRPIASIAQLFKVSAKTVRRVLPAALAGCLTSHSGLFHRATVYLGTDTSSGERMDWKRLEDLTRHLGGTQVEVAAMDGIDLNEWARLALAGKTLAEAQRALASANKIGPNLNAVFAARDRVDGALAAWNAIDVVKSSRPARSRR